MKPEELSIGNYIGYEGSPNIVTGITPPYPGKDPYYSNTWLIEINPPDCFWVRLDEIYPLELDLDWMERFGFKRHKVNISGADMWQGMDGYSKEHPLFSGWMFRGVGESKVHLTLVGFINSRFTYVHELQNIYKALTKTELK